MYAPSPSQQFPDYDTFIRHHAHILRLIRIANPDRAHVADEYVQSIADNHADYILTRSGTSINAAHVVARLHPEQVRSTSYTGILVALAYHDLYPALEECIATTECEEDIGNARIEIYPYQEV